MSKRWTLTPREYETYRLRRGDILLAEASGSVDEVGSQQYGMVKLMAAASKTPSYA